MTSEEPPKYTERTAPDQPKTTLSRLPPGAFASEDIEDEPDTDVEPVDEGGMGPEATFSGE